MSEGRFVPQGVLRRGKVGIFELKVNLLNVVVDALRELRDDALQQRLYLPCRS